MLQWRAVWLRWRISTLYSALFENASFFAALPESQCAFSKQLQSSHAASGRLPVEAMAPSCTAAAEACVIVGDVCSLHTPGSSLLAYINVE